MELSQFEKDAAVLAQNTVNNPEFHQISAAAGNAALHPRELPTVLQLDEHVENFGTTIAAAASPALETPPLSAIYAAARPVLLLVQGLLFFKPKWATAIRILVAGLDAEFPAASKY
jgi:hypothetical protein